MLKVTIKPLVCFLFFVSFSLKAQEKEEVYIIHDIEDKIILNDYAFFALDTANVYNLPKEILQQSALFRPYSAETLPYIWHTNYWFKIKIRNELKGRSRFYLRMPNLELLDYYLIYPSRRVIHKKAGEGRKTADRNLPNFPSSITLEMPYQQEIVVLVRARMLENFTLLSEEKKNIEIGLPEHYLRVLYQDTTFDWFFQGALWVMICYNLLIFIVSRDKTYFYYFVFLLSVSLTQWNVSLYSNLFVSHYFPLLREFFWTIVVTAIVVSYTFFIQHYVSLRLLSPRWYKILSFTAVAFIVFGILMLLVLIIGNEIVYSFSAAYNLSLLLYLILIAFLLASIYRLNKKLVIYSLLGTSIYLVLNFIFIFPLVAQNAAPDFEGFNMQKLGILCEVVFFSMGLAYRSKKNEQEKREAQEALVLQLKENEALQSKVQQELEEKVQERTLKLQESNEELQVLNEELRQTQEEVQAQRDFVEQQNKTLKQANNQVALSINSAKTIQEALLPTQEKLTRSLKNHFLIYRPKDVVSGDFYWVTEENNAIYLATADCTGHGVPGAFMANMGITFLYSIIKQKKIYSPAEILENLHQEISVALKQNMTGNNNGMDLTVLRIEKNKSNDITKMTFAGAKHNLLYFDKTKEELVELKGTRKSIGGIQNKNTKFENREFSLSKGSLIYLGSDGLEDQNNAKRKKFGKKRIKEIIEKNYDLPLEEQQKVFEQELEQHMEGTLQRDDILWAGVRV